MYTEQQKRKIRELANLDYSGRKIAAELGLSKSGVNYYLASLDDTEPPKENSGAKILVFDIETAAAEALTFGRFKINLGQDNIIKEGGWILCASYRWLGDEEVYTMQLTSDEVDLADDSRIVGELWELYEQADAVVAHNAQQFDHKMLQARVAYHNYPPLPTVKVLDTLILAKKHLRLPSNKLDSIGEYFGLGRKVNHDGISLWKRVQTGDKAAMQEMVVYCKEDTELLTRVYLRLRAFGHAGSEFNAGIYHNDSVKRCRRCGSHDVHPTGRTTRTALSAFSEYRCGECGAVQRDREATTTRERRKGLLV